MSKKIAYTLSIVAAIITLVTFFTINDNFKNQQTQIGSSSTASSASTGQSESNEKTPEEIEKEKLQNELPDVHISDWDLVLVNFDHPLVNENVELKTLDNGYAIDKRIVDAYTRMQTDAKQEGVDLTLVSAYRSVAYQQQLFNEDVEKYKVEGMNEEEAVKKTKEYMTEPGKSEHHTGLAIDVSTPADFEQNGLAAEFGDTKEGKWLNDKAAQYGFVVRYPKGKEAITQINYEPWHLRYVGVKNAEYMVKHQLVLEEYLELLKKAGK